MTRAALPTTELAPHRVPLRLVLPPYDDEREGAAASPGPLAQVLPLTFPAVAATPVAGAPRPLDLPAPGPVAARALTGIVEVLGSHRPARHLLPVMAPEVVARLERRVRLQPRPAVRQATAPMPRPRLRRVRVTQPSPTVCEVCAVLAAGERYRALALRLDWTGRGWLVTALEGC